MVTEIKNAVPQSVKNLRHNLISHISHMYYGSPSHKLKVIGVTGTDGKTTTSNIIYEILKADGKKVGLISTINARIGDKSYDTGFHVTTPDPEDISRFLKEMEEEGLEYVVLETTSHALYQNRVGAVKYIGAVYTNITHEHLDHHGTYENYLKHKARLMSKVKKGGFAILNKDDMSYELLKPISQRHSNLKIIEYGVKSPSDITASDIKLSASTSSFKCKIDQESFDVTLNMPGEYNVYNALAAISATKQVGVANISIVNALEGISQLAGRWEVMQSEPFKIIVDFAHTPNALEKALKTAKEQTAKNKKIIVVFGAAGKRDSSKRSLMGEAAGKYADITILTAEDPRGENVESINEQIAEGLIKHKKTKDKDYFSITDRGQAIETAIKMAKKGDLVIITGKGHEQSMNINGKEETPWSDQAHVQKILNPPSLRGEGGEAQ